jgi:hypothetical protein
VLKCEDGSHRPTSPAVAAFLAGFGHELDGYDRVPVENSRGEVVGEVTCL